MKLLKLSRFWFAKSMKDTMDKKDKTTCSEALQFYCNDFVKSYEMKKIELHDMKYACILYHINTPLGVSTKCNFDYHNENHAFS